MDQYLVGWKAIAIYVGVSVRSAQRYERTLGLPVERLAQPGRSEMVRADRGEVDRWLQHTATTRAADRAEGAREAGLMPAVEPSLLASNEVPAVPSNREIPRDAPRVLSTSALVALWLATVVVTMLVTMAVTRVPTPALPRATPIVPAGSPPSNIVGDVRGQLVGRIAVDHNGNGQWDAGEPFIGEPGRDCPHTETVSGFIVRWAGAADGSTAALNCNPEPFYHGRLPPGRYLVTLETPPGWRATSPTSVAVDIEPGRDTHLWFAVIR
jgi:hypothetical protein